MAKRLFLLRHGKAERGTPPGGTDRDRRLVERGIAESRLMGAYCRDRDMLPTLALCSPATRTIETLAAFREGLDSSLPDQISEDLYMGSAQAHLGVIRTGLSEPSRPEGLLVIGHNPSMHMLALELAQFSRGRSVSQLAEKFPTAALAIFEARIESWAKLSPGATDLVTYVTPKDIR